MTTVVTGVAAVETVLGGRSPVRRRTDGGARARTIATAHTLVALVGAGLILGVAAPSAGAAEGAATTTVATTTVATTTVATTTAAAGTPIRIGGIVAPGVDAAAFELGVQARLARTGRRGVPAVEYLRTEPVTDQASADAAVRRLSAEVLAVVVAGDSAAPAALAAASVPFAGAAEGVGWFDADAGASYVGVDTTGSSTGTSGSRGRVRAVSPAWGDGLAALLGGTKGRSVAVVVESTPAGAERAAAARASLRAAGFGGTTVVQVAAPATPGSPVDAAPVLALADGAGAVDVVLLLTATPVALSLSGALTSARYVGLVGVGPELYRPGAAAVAEGLTVLVPFAPVEQATTANRRLLADVAAIRADAVVTADVLDGYWSTDLLVGLVDEAGRRPTRAALLRATKAWEHDVTDTLGPLEWPRMRRGPVPCGALAQSDGLDYVVVRPYTCGDPVRMGR